jgi:AraC family carnitine catabolism transcriptional activator
MRDFFRQTLAVENPMPRNEDRDVGSTGAHRWARAGGRIGFLLLPKFSMLELFCAVDSLRIANRLGQCGFEWLFFSLDGRSVTASNGVTVEVTQRFGATAPPPILFVVASFEPEAAVNQQARAILRRMARQGVLLGALDTGTFILARAGLLDGRRVTLHWEAIAAFTAEFPDLEVTSNLFELHRDRLTCSGGSASIDMMLHLIALQRGEELARAVTEQIVHPRMRSGKDAQRLTPKLRYGLDDPDVTAGISLMEAHLRQPLRMADIARRIGVSQRQLERLYRRHLGQTAKSFYVGLRLERARQLLIDSRSSVNDAALGTGFESVAHFSRSFRRTFGHAPRAARVHGATPAMPGRSPR